ncbi:MAG: lipopolysaccharide heptosyltransferase II [Betaproteobacteria bacterium]|nr:lipopolysaccharide heptosyltransferase II [Betaproteobacteria bacterium]
MPVKVLIVGPSWVGDTILAQPLFQLLQARSHGIVLDVLAPPWTAPLLARMPEVRRAIPNPFAHGKLKLGARRRLGRTLAAEGYDEAIVLPNSFKSALVPFFAGIRRRTGYRGEMRYGVLNDVRRLDETATPLMVERFAALAGAAGEALPRPLPRAHLKVDAAGREAVLRGLGLEPRGPLVAFCPGAEFGPAKRWPAAHFAELARRMAARGREVWLIGSPRDAAIGDEIAQLSGGAGRNLCGKTSLDGAIDLLAGAELVISNDSGLMHVAAALDRPLVALYGSSSPSFTPPISAAATILKLDLPCSPCFERECPLGHFKCMRELTPETVDARAAERL